MTTKHAAMTTIDRRSLLLLGGAALVGTSMAAGAPPAWASGPPGSPILDRLDLPLPAVTPYDEQAFDRSQFTGAEQRLAALLLSLPQIANDMEDTDPDTLGWFNGGYSIYPPHIHSGRNQESVLTLAFFYTYRRPWNVYYRDPALRDRIYAAMHYYLRMQSPEGWWPANNVNVANRASTGFGLYHLGRAAVLLEQTGWDPVVRSEVIDGLQLAAQWFLDPDNDDVWISGVRVSNQIHAAMAGIGAMLDLLPAWVRPAWDERMDYMVAHSQSAGAGYLYEGWAFDAHYSQYTALPELAAGFQYTGDLRFLRMGRKHLDWCQYNYLWEPDGVGWTINGVSTRMSLRSLVALRTDNLSGYPDYLNVFDHHFMGRATNWPAEHIGSLQQQWWDGEIPVTVLPASGISAVRTRLRRSDPVYPPQSQRTAAIDQIRYLRRTRFVEARTDATYDQSFVFVRRPGYYFGSHHGVPHSPTNRVRRGPSFFYHPSTGALVQTQMATDSAWGAMVDGAHLEALGGISATGDHVPESDFGYAYLGADGDVTRTFTVSDQALSIAVQAPAVVDFTERIPLVLWPSDVLEVSIAGQPQPYQPGESAAADSIRLLRGSAVMEITFSQPRTITLTPTDVVLFAATDRPRTVADLDVQAGGSSLEYQLSVSTA